MTALFVVGGVIVVGTLFGQWYFSRRRRLIRELDSTEAVAIEKFPEGVRAKIVGTLEFDGKPLVSPLTGRECAYYHITVEEKIKSGNNSRWYEIIREEKRLHFRLADASGIAIVDTGAAEVVADVCVELKSGTFDDPSPQEEEYLATHGKRGKDWFFNKALRYREGILEAGEMVSVYGRGVREPDPEGVDEAEGYRGLPPMRLRMSGSFDEPLLISDNEATID